VYGATHVKCKLHKSRFQCAYVDKSCFDVVSVTYHLHKFTPLLFRSHHLHKDVAMKFGSRIIC